MSTSAASLHAVLDAHIPFGATGLVVALSGGADSSSLLIAAAELGVAFRGLPLRAVHIDHGLQAAAAEFVTACTALCASLAVPLAVVRATVIAPTGTSVEAAAREARYAALASQLRAGECLLTAHHRQDQAETMLLQALRGAGPKGLSAMPICREFAAGWHVRPLLDLTSRELHGLGAARSHGHAVDPMNEDLRFDRTYLRRMVWPLIEERWPGAGTALSRSARHMAEAQELLDATAANEMARLRDGEALLVPALRTLAAAERCNAVRFWLNGLGVEPPSTARLTEALRQMFAADGDQLPSVVWGEHALRRYRQRLLVTPAHPPRLDGVRRWFVASDSRLALGPRLGHLRMVPQAGGLAAERMPEALLVRPRAGGETLKPARLARTQSLQHLCQSHGVLPWMRDALPCVFAEDVLIAVGDLWMDARWRAAAGAPGLSFEWQNAPNIS